MEELVKKRNVAFERLKMVHASAKQFAEREPEAFEVHDRLRKLAEMEESFDRLQAEIEETVPAEELPSVLRFRLDYERLFFETKAMITKLLQEEHLPGGSHASSDATILEPKGDLKEAVRLLLETQRVLLSSQATASTNMQELAVQFRQQKIEPIDTQLPSYNLPVFRGDRKQWASFKDLFISGVHNKNLTSALKLQLLMSHLEGEARSLVSSYSITDANYKQVWDTLVEHFDKPKFTVAALVQEFCDQPTIKGSNLPNLRKLVSTSDEVIRQLSALDCETRDPWLNHIVLRKLDDGLRSQWAQHIVDIDDPKFDDLLKFLKRKCEALETCAAFGGKPSLEFKKKSFKEDRKQQSIKKEIQAFNAVQQSSCPVCEESHRIYDCTVFKEYSVGERRERVQQAKLCFNCLRPNHCAKFCPSKSVCRTPNCQQRHHTMLCKNDNSETITNKPSEKRAPSSSSPQQPQGSAAVTAAVDTQPAVSCSTNVKNTSSSVVIGLLPTALVRVKRIDGQFQEVRAMIDSGSQASLITEHCVTTLGLQRSNANLIVTGIASCSSETTRGAVDLEIFSRFHVNPVVNIKAYVLSKFPRIVPNQRLNPERLKCLDSLQLADPEFHKPGSIDIILGADVFLAILEDGKVKDETGLPVAINSSFGWIVAGQVFDASEMNCNTAIVSLNMNMDVDKVLRKFWEVEEVNKPKPLTPEEQQAVDFFRTTYQRDEFGRFTVRLPFDQSKPALGESLPAAVQRLKAMERKFARDPEFKRMYVDFMAEYLNLGHMERVPDDEVNISPEKSFYLPHHGVVREDSITTRIRVVYDGSCVSSSGISLNEKLLTGPKVTEDLAVILTRFRSYAYAFMADAEKMYRQTRVHQDDVDYQRIVWREDADKPIEHYRLLTVTYGTSCAPFLAVETLRQAARDSRAQYPVAADRVVKNSYVDDFLSGAATLEEALKLKKDIVRITSEAGFHLRKWSANDPRLLEEDANGGPSSVPVHLHPEAESVKALGIHWYPATDAFGFKLNFDIGKSNTKRQLLSDSARLFDPLGWISPIIVRIKILYQTLWLQDLQWDDPLPAVINKEWNIIKASLAAIEDIRVPRWIVNHNGAVQLHGFADASEAAYAAVVYARSTDDDGNVSVSLVASKTKVAPIQQVSLPRLELNAAVLLVEVMKQVLESLDHLKVPCHAWTDSTIVLGWLTSHPKKWKTFVANRTSAILDFLPRSSWRHISSNENPADCASRGLLPTELVGHKLWWTGPPILYENEDIWKESARLTNIEEDTTERRSAVSVATAAVKPTSNWQIEERFLKRNTSLKSAQRELAWVYRFKFNSLAKLRGAERIAGPLKPSEVQDANLQLARFAQQEVFGRDIDQLRKGQALPSNSKLKSLFPFIDEDGTLRVGGRLQNSNQPFHMKHPIILPKSHNYTLLLISMLHQQNLHAGPTLIIATLQQRYWVIGCDSVVRSVVNSCVRCVRWKAKTANQLMGSVPTVRTESNRAFENVGVDYAGPVTIKASLLRSVKTVKGYIAVFVCLATKAVHLEAVTDLSANTFISALKRFCARRGLPNQIWSDNGTNFVGADRQLKELLASATFNTAVDLHLSNLGIQWSFITPSAPHMGGIWEAAVRSMKKHMRRVLGTNILNFEDLATLLTQIEACLNSRPLCALSSSIDSCEALTPGHFVIGQPLNLVPEPSVASVPMNRLDRFGKLQKITEEFWERFRTEYVATLQPRTKWQKIEDNLKIGDLVLVKNENTPPAYWELARVVATHPDRSGIVRTVTLKKGQTSYQRPIHKLVVLPTD